MTGLARPLFAVALTRPGAEVARRIAQALPGVRVQVPARYAAVAEEGFAEPVAELLARLWPTAGGLFLVMAAGVAVRSLAPLLRDKARDPAVLVLDPAGEFVVPLLGGHLGGANDLALQLSECLGATPVLTTATDVAGRPAVEVWARRAGLVPADKAGVVRVNGAWANGEPVTAYLDPALDGAAPIEELRPHLAQVTEDLAAARRCTGALLAVSHRLGLALPGALVLHPRCLALGVGCRRGADPGRVERGVRDALERAGLAAAAVAAVATVEAKRGEPALEVLARGFRVPLQFFAAAQLAAIEVPHPSLRVARAVATPSVAEAAALAAGAGGRLLLSKVKGTDWTLAAALRRRSAWVPGGGEAGGAGAGPGERGE